MSKLNYLITLLIPFFILGLIPLLIWTFISFNNVILSSIIFIVSIANLGACSNDLYNFIEA
ncbi:metalloprotease family protein [Clostridium perfringens]